VNHHCQNQFADLRETANLTVSEAAKFLRVTEDTIKALDEGSQKPDISIINALEDLSLILKDAQPTQVNSEIKFIDLFAGIGGFHIALHNLGAECVFASEINPYARKTYIANHSKISPKLFKNNQFIGDIKSVNLSQLPNFDILCAGFPCQPFSQAGFKKGFEDETENRGNLFFDIVKIIKHKKPSAFFLENVRHIKNHDNGRTFDIVKQSLEALGYSFLYKMVKASDHGLPQHRPRIFMVGFKGETTQDSRFKFPDPEPLDLTMSDIFGKPCNKAIGYTLRVGGRGSGIMDRRNWDSYSVDGEIIRIGSQEGKKMMGLPDDFTFPVSETQAMKQLGNSVAVPAVQATAENIIAYLTNKPLKGE